MPHTFPPAPARRGRTTIVVLSTLALLLTLTTLVVRAPAASAVATAHCGVTLDSVDSFLTEATLIGFDDVDDDGLGGDLVEGFSLDTGLFNLPAETGVIGSFGENGSIGISNVPGTDLYIIDGNGSVDDYAVTVEDDNGSVHGPITFSPDGELCGVEAMQVSAAPYDRCCDGPLNFQSQRVPVDLSAFGLADYANVRSVALLSTGEADLIAVGIPTGNEFGQSALVELEPAVEVPADEAGDDPDAPIDDAAGNEADGDDAGESDSEEDADAPGNDAPCTPDDTVPACDSDLDGIPDGLDIDPEDACLPDAEFAGCDPDETADDGDAPADGDDDPADGDDDPADGDNETDGAEADDADAPADGADQDGADQDGADEDADQAGDGADDADEDADGGVEAAAGGHGTWDGSDSYDENGNTSGIISVLLYDSYRGDCAAEGITAASGGFGARTDITVTCVPKSTWLTMTDADFDLYDVLWIGADRCQSSSLADFDEAVDSRAVWETVVDPGRVWAVGGMVDYHYYYNRSYSRVVTHDALAFVANGSGPGLVLQAGCYGYYGADWFESLGGSFEGLRHGSVTGNPNSVNTGHTFNATNGYTANSRYAWSNAMYGGVDIVDGSPASLYNLQWLNRRSSTDGFVMSDPAFPPSACLIDRSDPSCDFDGDGVTVGDGDLDDNDPCANAVEDPRADCAGGWIDTASYDENGNDAGTMRVLLYDSYYGDCSATGIIGSGGFGAQDDIDVTCVPKTTWSTMAAEDFAAYDVLWIGADDCAGRSASDFAEAVASRPVWETVIDPGHVWVIGGLADYHYYRNRSYSRQVVHDGLAFVADGSGPGVVLQAGCYAYYGGEWFQNLGGTFEGLTHAFGSVTGNPNSVNATHWFNATNGYTANNRYAWSNSIYRGVDVERHSPAALYNLQELTALNGTTGFLMTDPASPASVCLVDVNDPGCDYDSDGVTVGAGDLDDNDPCADATDNPKADCHGGWFGGNGTYDENGNTSGTMQVLLYDSYYGDCSATGITGSSSIDSRGDIEVTCVPKSTWTTMTAEDFAVYDVLWIGSDFCAGRSASDFDQAVASRPVWEQAIDPDRVWVLGGMADYHYYYNRGYAQRVVHDGLAYVADGAGPGVVLHAGCYAYYGADWFQNLGGTFEGLEHSYDNTSGNPNSVNTDHWFNATNGYTAKSRYAWSNSIYGGLKVQRHTPAALYNLQELTALSGTTGFAMSDPGVPASICLADQDDPACDYDSDGVTKGDGDLDDTDPCADAATLAVTGCHAGWWGSNTFDENGNDAGTAQVLLYDSYYGDCSATGIIGSSGIDSLEEYEVTCVSKPTWASMTAEDFAVYDVLWIGSDFCAGRSASDFDEAVASRAVWEQAIDPDRVWVLGGMADYHYYYNRGHARSVVHDGLAYVASGDAPGLVLQAGCYSYYGADWFQNLGGTFEGLSHGSTNGNPNSVNTTHWFNATNGYTANNRYAWSNAVYGGIKIAPNSPAALYRLQELNAVGVRTGFSLSDPAFAASVCLSDVDDAACDYDSDGVTKGDGDLDDTNPCADAATLEVVGCHAGWNDTPTYDENDENLGTMRVLVYDSYLGDCAASGIIGSGGFDDLEDIEVTCVSKADWTTMSAEDFDYYDVLWIGTDNCAGRAASDFDQAVASRPTWEMVVDAERIWVAGGLVDYHYYRNSGHSRRVTNDALAYLASGSGAGVVLHAGCYDHYGASWFQNLGGMFDGLRHGNATGNPNSVNGEHWFNVTNGYTATGRYAWGNSIYGGATIAKGTAASHLGLVDLIDISGDIGFLMSDPDVGPGACHLDRDALDCDFDEDGVTVGDGDLDDDNPCADAFVLEIDGCHGGWFGSDTYDENGNDAGTMRVLLYDSVAGDCSATGITGATGWEARPDIDVTCLPKSDWTTMTEADFATYDAIWIGADNCGGTSASDFNEAVSSRPVWEQVIDPSRVMVAGGDYDYHYALNQGHSRQVTHDILAFISNGNAPGLLLQAGCYSYSGGPWLQNLGGTFDGLGHGNVHGDPDAVNTSHWFNTTNGYSSPSYYRWSISIHGGMTIEPGSAVNYYNLQTITSLSGTTGFMMSDPAFAPNPCVPSAYARHDDQPENGTDEDCDGDGALNENDTDPGDPCVQPGDIGWVGNPLSNCDNDDHPQNADPDDFNPCNPDFDKPGCKDTDGDGVPDQTDLDDDNDGILDMVEACAAAAAPFLNSDLNAYYGLPTSYTQLYQAEQWFQASGATSDYMHVDGYMAGTGGLGLAVPSPDGGGFAGMIGGARGYGAQYYEYVGGNLVEPITPGTYTFTMEVGTVSDNTYGGPINHDVAVYGVPNASYLPFGGYVHVNSAGIGAVELGRVRVNLGAQEWTTVSFELTVAESYPAIVIGPEDQSYTYTLVDNFRISTDGAMACDDTDGDVMPDNVDLDSDNDGIADLYEAGDPVTSGLDTNGNGTLDSGDAGGFIDDDVDGLDDRIEFRLGQDTGVAPIDSFNTAGDSLADVLDLDSDDDGIPDATEARATSAYVAYPTSIGDSSDTDDDGVLDIFDTGSSFGSTATAFKTAQRTPNADGDDGADTTPDYLDLDSDADGASDAVESDSPAISGISYANPDGNVNNPLSGADGSIVMENVDPNATDVDFRSVLAPDGDNDGYPVDDDPDDDDPCVPDRHAGVCDADGDGKVNNEDLDDDNDGIVDTVECAAGEAVEVPGATYDTQETFGSFTFDYQSSSYGSPGAPLTWPSVQNTEGFSSAEIPSNSPETGGGSAAAPNIRISHSGGSLTSITIRIVAVDSGNSEFVTFFGTETDPTGSTLSVEVSAPDGSSGLIFDPGTGRLNPNGSGAGGEITISSTVPFSSLAMSSVGPYNVISSIVSGVTAPEASGSTETDGDGIRDCLDLDSDNDGIADLYEGGASVARDLDTNGNGFIDAGDAGGFVDADDDGLDDRIESAFGNDVGVNPVDSSNAAEDSLADVLDLDSDDDGIPDATEARATAAYVAYPGVIDTSADTDNDGILDVFDAGSEFGSNAAGFKTTTNPPNDDIDDDDGIADYLDLDSDGDDASDTVESDSPAISGISYADPDGNVNDPMSGAGGSILMENVDAYTDDVDFRSAFDPDSDNDGYPYDEDPDDNDPCVPARHAGSCDADDDGIINSFDLDDDNDGILDIHEGQAGGVFTEGIISNGDFNQGYVDSNSPGVPYTSAAKDAPPPPWQNLLTADRSSETQISFSENIVNRSTLSGFELSPTGGSFMGYRRTEGIFQPVTIVDPDEELVIRYDYTEYLEPGQTGDAANVNLEFRIKQTSFGASNDGSLVEAVPNLTTTGGTAGTWESRSVAFIPSNYGIAAGTAYIAIAAVDSEPLVWAFVDGFGVLEGGSCGDTDGDTICDLVDLDSDNDGIADMYEAGSSPVRALDTNNDGTLSVADGFVDVDEDGLDDRIEFVLGADTGAVPIDSFDTAGDDLADVIDLDSDDDGIPDATEARATEAYVAYPLTINGSADSDDDGILDIFDNTTNFGSTDDAFRTNGRRPNADGDDIADSAPDYIDLDADGDGLSDVDESDATTISGVSYGDPDGNINDPLSDADGSIILENVDIDLFEADWRSGGGLDPCGGGSSTLSCDSDGDGTPDNEDPAPFDPCVPDPFAVVCGNLAAAVRLGVLAPPGGDSSADSGSDAASNDRGLRASLSSVVTSDD